MHTIKEGSSRPTQEGCQSCPKAGLEYRGTCPIQECPSNIGNKHITGCAILATGQSKLGVADISNLMGESARSVKAKIGEGMRNILSLVEIIEIAEASHTECTTCGHKKAEDCHKEPNMCKERRLLARAVRGEMKIIAKVASLDTCKIGSVLENNKGRTALKSLLRNSNIVESLT